MTQDTIIVTDYRRPGPLHTMPLDWLWFCLIGCLVTDIVYWRTAEMMWANFSAWFVSIAAVLAVVTLVTMVFDVAAARLLMPRNAGWLAVVGYVVLIVMVVVNAMIHTHDAWTSVVPWGLALSAVSVVLCLAVGVWKWMSARNEEVVTR